MLHISEEPHLWCYPCSALSRIQSSDQLACTTAATFFSYSRRFSRYSWAAVLFAGLLGFGSCNSDYNNNVSVTACSLFSNNDFPWPKITQIHNLSELNRRQLQAVSDCGWSNSLLKVIARCLWLSMIQCTENI